MKINVKFFVLKLLFLISFNKLKSQELMSTVGTDFWLSYLTNYYSTSESLDLFLSGNESTTGTISSPLQGWSINFSITPGVTTTITIPEGIGGNYLDDVVSNKSIHIESNDTISVYAINFNSYTADASIILPVKSLGTNYLISTYTPIAGGESEFVIVATANNSEIEIIPSVQTLGGHPAGIPYIIHLNEGETYQVKSTADLTGTIVKGTQLNGACRPFCVFSGVTCANIPSGCNFCDHIFDQNYPIYTWGKKYHLVPFLNATSYTSRILARDNNTTITLNNGSQIILNSGQFVNYSNVSNNQFISADKPISVIQYMEGLDCAGSGDPSMLILNSDESKINEITFSTIASTVITNHSINIIVESTDVNNVLLDGVPINPNQFTQFNSDPLKSFARLGISEGSHHISLSSGFIAYSYGTGDAESYAYGIGSFLLQQEINVDTSYCSTDSVVLYAGNNLFDPWWSIETNPTDTIAAGNTLVLYAPFTNDIYIANGFSLISGCEDKKYYSVESPNPPLLNLSVSDDSVCKFIDINFNVDIDPPSSSYDILWEPSLLFNQPTSQNPTVNAQQSGWYRTTVSSFSGCSTAKDSIYINIYPFLNISLGNDTTFCSYDQLTIQLDNVDSLNSYVWNTGDNTQSITVNTEGNYSILATDLNSCVYKDTIFADEIIAPSPVISGFLDYCPDLTTNLQVTNVVYNTYLWSTGEFDNTITVGAPNYQIWVQVGDEFNCFGSDTVYLNALPDVDLGEDYAICPNDFTQLNALINGALSYEWSNGQTTPTIIASPGTYDVEVISNTCVMRDTITILPKPLPTLKLEVDTTICPGQDIVIIPLVSGYDSLIWSNGTTHIPYIYDQPTIMFDTIQVSATAYGCGSVSDKVSIYVENCDCIVYVPNTFTPDGDDLNNVFAISHLCDIVNFEMIIYNRWGEIVFKSNIPDFQWDGISENGSKLVKNELYTWVMSYQSINSDGIAANKVIRQNGFILMLK